MPLNTYSMNLIVNTARAVDIVRVVADLSCRIKVERERASNFERQARNTREVFVAAGEVVDEPRVRIGQWVAGIYVLSHGTRCEARESH